MSFAATAGLGAVAGLTVFLGLPVARIGRPSPPRLAFLTAASVGVLLFILYDVLKNASQPVATAIDQGSTGLGLAYAGVLAAGLAIGLLGLVAFESLFKRRQRRLTGHGPGAMTANAASASAGARRDPVSTPARVAVFIAVGIGLHNFSEGLAIGQSSAAGAYRLFLLLVIGFGLHNITEGFGVTAPLSGQRPAWRFLGLLGLIAGGPTFVGTVIGYQFTNTAISILFLSLAAGAIVYVIGELQHAGRKIGAHNLAMVGLLTGFLAGYATDLLLHIAGA